MAHPCGFDDRAVSLYSLRHGDVSLSGRRHMFLTYPEYTTAFSRFPNLSCEDGGGVLRDIIYSGHSMTMESTRHLTNSLCVLCSEPTTMQVRACIWPCRAPARQRCVEKDEIDLREGWNLIVWHKSLGLVLEKEDRPYVEGKFGIMPNARDVWEREVCSMDPEIELPTSSWPVWRVPQMFVVTKRGSPSSMKVCAILELLRQNMEVDGWATIGNQMNQMMNYGWAGDQVHVIELWMEKLVKPVWNMVPV